MKKLVTLLSIVVVALLCVVGCEKPPVDYQAQADVVIVMIEALPEETEVELSDETDIVAAREAYDDLHTNAQALVTNVDKLEGVEAALQALKNPPAPDYQAEADVVIALIEAIPVQVQLSDEEGIVFARSAYDGLSSEAKALVTNLDKLEDAEAQLYLLKNPPAPETIAVTGVTLNASTLTLTVGESATLVATVSPANATNKAVTFTSGNKAIATVSAEGSVNALKAGVAIILVQTVEGSFSAYCTVTVEAAAQTPDPDQAAASEVEALISALPSVDEIQLSDEAQVVAARSAYEALTATQKALVTNLSTLVNAEARIEQLTLPEYMVTMYANGGEIEGLTPVAATAPDLQYAVNYYTTGFFSASESDVFLAKASILDITDSKYTYWIRLGLEATGELYTVNQVIASGTAFDASNKTSTYYLMASEGNATAYSQLCGVATGAKVAISVALPEAATNSLGATVSVFKTQSSPVLATYYQEIYAAGATLPTPVKTGYTFEGWYENASFAGNAVTAATFTGSVYASWTENAPTPPATVAVTGVTLNAQTLSLNVGGSATLVATVLPTNATNQNVAWSTTQTAVVQLSQNGEIVALGAGVATVTVTTADGSFTATCEVTVSDPDQEAANEVENLISSLPSVLELELTDEAQVAAARSAYEALTSAQKALVSNLSTLVNAEARIEELKIAAQTYEVTLYANGGTVAGLALTEVATPTLTYTVNYYSTGYFDVHTSEVFLVKTSLLDSFNFQWWQKIGLNRISGNRYSVVQVLPAAGGLAPFTESNRTAEYYLLISSEYSGYADSLAIVVGNVVDISVALPEAATQTLGATVAVYASNPATSPDSYYQTTYTHNALLPIPTREGYIFNGWFANDSFSGSAVSAVTKAETLYASWTQSDELVANEVENLISSLPSVLEIELTDEAQVAAARSAYEALTSAQKALVSNLSTLVNAEARIEELQLASAPDCTVKLHLNGATLENAEYVVTKEHALQFAVDYYSTGYYEVYESQIILAKASLISSTYPWWLRIGLDKVDDGLYYATQVIPADATNFTAENKTADYYLMVSSSYTSAYNMLVGVTAGHHVTVDKQLPSYATNKLGATVSVYVGNPYEYEGNYYQATLKEGMTLPTPVKSGFVFEGWYANASLSGEPIVKASAGLEVYASWTYDEDLVLDETEILSCVSASADENTNDFLPEVSGYITYEWSSSNPELYVIDQGYGRVNKAKQSHVYETVTVTVTGTKQDGSSFTKTKDITVAPIAFEQLPASPIATYYAVDGATNYSINSERYQTEGTFYSQKARETLDIVYWAFASFDAEASVWISTTGVQQAALAETLSLRALGVRVILMLNGASLEGCQNFQSICGNQTLRGQFVRNIMDVVEEYGFDGVDVDWEAVDPGNGYKVEADKMNALMIDMRQEMTNRTGANGTPYFLSVAVPANTWGTEADDFDFATINNLVDYVNLMSYDMNNPLYTTHLSPLYPSENEKGHGFGFGCHWGVEHLVSLGVTKSKIIIGGASYGKVWQITEEVTTTDSHALLGKAAELTEVSGITVGLGTAFGPGIMKMLADSSYQQFTEYDSQGRLVGSYLYNPTTKIFVSYDSPAAVQAKYEYAISQGVGMMWWDYSNDTGDLVIDNVYAAIQANA